MKDQSEELRSIENLSITFPVPIRIAHLHSRWEISRCDVASPLLRLTLPPFSNRTADPDCLLTASRGSMTLRSQNLTYMNHDPIAPETEPPYNSSHVGSRLLFSSAQLRIFARHT